MKECHPYPLGQCHTPNQMPRTRLVLIVEDDDDLRRLYVYDLSRAGYRTAQARSGFEALRLLESEQPDLVLLDLGLPGLDGVVVRQELAAQAHTRHIPVVVITGGQGPHDHLEVACVLKKPVTMDRLLSTVRACLGSGAPLEGS